MSYTAQTAKLTYSHFSWPGLPYQKEKFVAVLWQYGPNTAAIQGSS